jgi:hypothetical protein
MTGAPHAGGSSDHSIVLPETGFPIGDVLTRRMWLSKMLAVAAYSLAGRLIASSKNDELVLHERGGYWFLPGLSILSFAVRAADGYEVVRATFRSLRPFAQGMADIEAYLRAAGRPLQALCGVEIRSADPGSGVGLDFNAFNRVFLERLAKAGLLVNGASPLTRVNVSAPNVSEQSIYAFTYTVPLADARKATPPTFMTCAFPEVINIKTKPEMVAKGDTSLTGLRMKMKVVLDAVDDSLQKLELRWADVTGVQLYSVYDVQPLYGVFLAPRLGEVARRGIEWHFARPPVIGNDLEIAVRGIRKEELIEDQS